MSDDEEAFRTELAALIERLDWMLLGNAHGAERFADREEAHRLLADFLARWPQRFKHTDLRRLVQEGARTSRLAREADEQAYQFSVQLAIALRARQRQWEEIFAWTRAAFQERDQLPPDEQAVADQILGPREELLGEGYRNVEAGEAELEAHLAKMAREWPRRAGADFARRLRNASAEELAAWKAEFDVPETEPGAQPE